MYKYFKIIVIALVLTIIPINIACASLLEPSASQEILTRGNNLGSAAGFASGQRPGTIIALVISGFLSLLGVIFIILILVGGFHWMTAAGDEQKVTKAKETIQRAVIGLVIIVAAYSITYFVFMGLDKVMDG